MHIEVDGIRRVSFSVLSADDIRNRAACEITSVDLFSGGAPVAGGLYDPRMGVTEFGQRCATCHKDNKDCAGHPGFIELAVPLFNSLFVDSYLKKVLRCICLKCSRACLPASHASKPGPSESALAHAVDASSKVKECPFCATPRPERVWWNKAASLASFAYTMRGDTDQHDLPSSAIYAALRSITSDDCVLIGLCSDKSRPESLMFKALPVPPIAVRPPHKSGGQRRDDDITQKLAEIIKSNRSVRASIDNGLPAADVTRRTNYLQLDIIHLIENPGNGIQQARMKATNRPLKSIVSRLKGKEGRVRNNLLGKRVDFSARSVITAEPNISVEEVGLPVRIAMTLTFPEVVHATNIERLRQAVTNGPNSYPGARLLRQGGVVYSLDRPERRVRIDLKPGDIVERHIVDGDHVLVNRQPSLHRMSMMCHRVRVMPFDTIRLNVLVTEAYNADFDGDEMNVYLPQSASTAYEVKSLASVKSQIISPRHHRPIVGVVQDVALGLYLMTQDGVHVDVQTAANICARFARNMPTRALTGRELFSTILPNTVHCRMKNARIEFGELVEGCVGKVQFQEEGNGILHSIFAEDGADAAVRLLDSAQAMTCDWLMHNGHSMGASDLRVSDANRDRIAEICRDAISGVDSVLSDVHAGRFDNTSTRGDVDEVEDRITGVLESAHGKIIELVVAEGTESETRLIRMVRAKSKGNDKNIVQMAGVLGQNFIDNARMPLAFGDRAMPHFSRHDTGALARGFICSCFRDGLSPNEFYFHAMAGREGLIDTAVKTADVGYMQRRFVKALEDLQVAADGSVRDASHALVSHRYGGDGMDACAIETQTVPTFGGDLRWLAERYLLSRVDDDELDLILCPGARKAWQDLSADRLLALAQHFREVVEDKHFLVRCMRLNGKVLGDGQVAHAIGFERIIQRIGRIHNEDEVVSDLDIGAVLTAQNELVSELYPDDALATSRELGLSTADQNRRVIGAALVRAHLSPKVLVRRGITHAAFDDIVHAIRQRHYAGLASMSSMVGIIAAQSIAEPSTQMVLSAFHKAGSIGAHKASVPRVKELVNCSKSPRITEYQIRLLRGIDTSERFATAVRDRILCTHVRDVVARSQTVCENGVRANANDDRLDRLERILYIGDASHPSRADTDPQFVLRLDIDRDRMLEHGVRMLDLFAAVQSRVYADVVSSDDAADELAIRITPHLSRMNGEDLMSELRELESYVLDTRIKGVTGITKCVVQANKDRGATVYDASIADFTVREHFTLVAVAGSNASVDAMTDILAIDGVDAAASALDNLTHVYALFGIEAARSVLLCELQKAYNSDTYSDFRHIELLVDFMTRRGQLTAITRHGIGATDAGPLVKCSFEQTVQQLVRAAVFGSTDNMTGVSSNIMFGQTTPCGTGASQVVLDVDACDALPDGDVVSASVSRENIGMIIDLDAIVSFSYANRSPDAIPVVKFLQSGEIVPAMPWSSIPPPSPPPVRAGGSKTAILGGGACDIHVDFAT
jgi:DNA-directed RNA polymerase II subunit RPB1